MLIEMKLTNRCTLFFFSEIFFVPYIWDVIVGSLTASTFEWARDRIKVFPLNHPISDYKDDGIANTGNNHEDEHIHTQEVV